MLTKLGFLYKRLPTILLILLIFAGYIMIGLYQEKSTYKTELNKMRAEFVKYQTDTNFIKQLEIHLQKVIKDGQTHSDKLRNDIDNNFIQLRVKVESIEQDSTTSSHIADRALQLATFTRQDYYNLINGIGYNQVMINGWQQYYCSEIAPKNQTEFMCIKD
ncbi:lysis system i-spanin subunit Rz [Utexia brackfieldae]|uniref:lysis system i-spanin subunit Rz n=1 Tax=Utexia brackfieldae TaxID=3074108 RepID=UPI00370D4363